MNAVTVLLTPGTGDLAAMVAQAARLLPSEQVGPIVVFAPPGWSEGSGPGSVRIVPVSDPGASEAVMPLLENLATPYLLHLEGDVDPHPGALARMVDAAEDAGAILVYGDYLDRVGDRLAPHPLSDCQPGSLEDRFPLGPMRLWSLAAARRAWAACGHTPPDLAFHAWYDLRLRGSRVAPALHLPEPLAAWAPPSDRTSGQAVFDYLTAARARQDEAERVCTAHLEAVGARLRGPFRPYEPSGAFPVEASVVIPVRDRVRTVGEAVDSALGQEAPFAFNVIVVDNHSTDGTSVLLSARAAADPRLLHVVPARRDLGIGGCWNEALAHPACGRWAVQLDSDDLYADAHTLARMVGCLVSERAALAVGSYTTVDRSLAPLPPGLVDHREWTAENGPNNALRVGGLGAPRAFATEVVRRHPFPNVSYGEDYAVALRISREWRVGRVWDSVYLCRRWEDNTDADLPPEVTARHQAFKDRIRTIELGARRGTR
ncbi:MAG: glycosyltransferase family 2 protein [Deltaproteobacteria bacterium]|nr:glycosyltransferase family 2 protein [Deltaproteobacteria bacterium]